ncbi:hypothetical protein [Enterovirga sp. CN4-39]|uniref:hypothetical protein n=1 Tax=Enterovirga sp. CN4-39 TaxID=3400910 RepID=UPI003C1239CE
MAIPERKVALPGGRRESHCGVFALFRGEAHRRLSVKRLDRIRRTSTRAVPPLMAKALLQIAEPR